MYGMVLITSSDYGMPSRPPPSVIAGSQINTSPADLGPCLIITIFPSFNEKDAYRDSGNYASEGKAALMKVHRGR